MPVAVELTLAEASQLLDPPMGEAQLRAIVRALRLRPAGWQHQGGRGHPVARYDATRIFKIHALWLECGE